MANKNTLLESQSSIFEKLRSSVSQKPNFLEKPVLLTDTLVFQKIINRLKREWYQKTARLNPETIFLLGHPKAGTTVIAALLSEISGKTVIIDPIFRIHNSVQLRQQLQANPLKFERFINKHQYCFAADIVKDPYLIFCCDELLKYFPEAKFIFINREPRDNIRSILNRLEIPGNLRELESNYQEKLPKLPKGSDWREIIEGLLPPVSGNNYIERLAHRWNLAVDIYQANRDHLVYIRYEDFLIDKVGFIHDLAKKMKLEPIHDISERVDVQYQPRGDRHITWIDFFGEENLSRIETICKERMKLLDY